VRDYLPDPPTPTRSALPLGYLRILSMISKCSIANENSTKSIGLSLIIL